MCFHRFAYSIFYVLSIYLFIYLIIFVFIVFLPHVLLLTSAEIFFFRLDSTEPVTEKNCSEADNQFLPQLLLLLNQMSTRRKLWDIVQGIPETKNFFEVKIHQSSLSFSIQRLKSSTWQIRIILQFQDKFNVLNTLFL